MVANGGEVREDCSARNGVNSRKHPFATADEVVQQVRGDVRMSHARSLGNDAGLPPTDADTVIVGAGPQALTVLARWLFERPSDLRRVAVVESAGEWMTAWRAGFARQCIDVLRSPGVHHPAPDDMAFVNTHGNWPTFETACAAALRSGSVGPLQRPTTAAFWRFCLQLIEQTELNDRLVPATVVGAVAVRGRCGTSSWKVELDDGSTIGARQVVWAGNTRRRRVPAGVQLGGAVQHSGDVDLGAVGVGERIAVIGGGQSAGQLALRAAQRGAAVTVVSRGPRRVADLDVDAGWLMEDHLAPFRATMDPAERRRVVERVQCGSMTSDLDLELRRSRVARVVGAGEVTARPDPDRGPVVGFAGVECEVDRVWAATGSVPDLRVAPALAELAASGAPHIDGWPVLDDTLQWLDGFYVVGALAALTLGPAAGNLGGARAAADILANRGPEPCRTGISTY